MKAIETVYKGYRFRSRLEARWAVTFDALGIKWEYEKEGFDLGKFGRYLPDFYLPELSTWTEIRPSAEALAGEQDRFTCFIRMVSESQGAFLVIIGAPDPQSSNMLVGFCAPNGEFIFSSTWGICPVCGRSGIITVKALNLVEPMDLPQCFVHPSPCPCREIPAWFTPAIQKALLAGRQARFEHGENGWPAFGAGVLTSASTATGRAAPSTQE